MATRKIFFDKCALVSHINPGTNYPAGETYLRESPLFQELIFKYSKGLEAISDILYREFIDAKLCFYASSWNSQQYTTAYVNVDIAIKSFDENTITYDTAHWFADSLIIKIYEDHIPYYAGSTYMDLGDLQNLLAFGGKASSHIAGLNTPYGSHPPYLEIEFSDENVGLSITPTYPTGNATISKSLDTPFAWSAVPTSWYNLGRGGISPKSTKFRWKYSGDSSYSETEIGEAVSYTIPAGTFHTGTIEWQVAVTSTSGITTTTPWTSVEIKEPVPSTVIVSPKNAVLDAAVPIEFQWSHVISNGTPQTKYDLQTSPDASAWATIRTESTPQTSTVFEANTLDGGDLYWRVRTYNSDGIAGDWSEAAHCIVIAAPDAPVIAITHNAPKFAIRWQQTGQRAYEIRLDGEVILKKFGLETSYEYGSYLEDGVHTVTVRIQNQYSLWSDWGFTDIVVGNNEGDAIHLSADAGDAVTLRWNAAAGCDGYLIYRDGVKIGESVSGSFTDHFAVGHVTYQVRGVLSGGNYTMSNSVEADASVSRMMIAAVDNPEWLDISLSASSLRRTVYHAAQFVTFKNYIGSALPSAEIGEHVSKTYSFDAAWPTKDRNSIEAFEKLLGKLVCIKTPYGGRFIGILNPIDRQENRFTTTFSASMTLVDWKEMGK